MFVFWVIRVDSKGGCPRPNFRCPPQADVAFSVSLTQKARAGTFRAPFSKLAPATIHHRFWQKTGPPIAGAKDGASGWHQRTEIDPSAMGNKRCCKWSTPTA